MHGRVGQGIKKRENMFYNSVKLTRGSSRVALFSIGRPQSSWALDARGSVWSGVRQGIGGQKRQKPSVRTRPWQAWCVVPVRCRWWSRGRRPRLSMTFLTTDDDARYLVAIRSDRLYNPWLLKSRSCVRRTLYDARTTTMVSFACCTSAIAWSTCHGYKNLDLLDTYAIHQAGTNVGYRPGLLLGFILFQRNRVAPSQVFGCSPIANSPRPGIGEICKEK
jgi:hypothetical protein